MKTPRRWTAIPLAAAAALALSASAALAQGAAQGNFLEALAGPDGNVSFVANRTPDGKAGAVRMKTKEDGAFERMEAEGALELKTPQFALLCRNLVFDGAANRLEAWGDVRIDQQGLRATCGRMVYDVATKEILLSETPRVEQDSEGSKLVFEGMDRFRIVTREDGSNEVQIDGGAEQIRIEFNQTGSGGSATGGAAGLGAMGDTVRIAVSPRGDTPGKVLTTVRQSQLHTFNALGSVRVQTDTFDLRSDQLAFDNSRQRLEALSNVFLKQEDIDADCSRMEYALDTDVITLTGNPVVRKSSPEGRTLIRQLERFVIRRNPNGTVTTDMAAPPGLSPDINFQQPADGPVRNGDAPTTAPLEIRLDDPSAVDAIPG
ncbi:MAG: LptA/OstA family protein [Candidatus Sumerlaeia bacterium]|nr:LptA/OstA family protein [Candidatus Sumerlaeia bacterium]